MNQETMASTSFLMEPNCSNPRERISNLGCWNIYLEHLFRMQLQHSEFCEEASNVHGSSCPCASETSSSHWAVIQHFMLSHWKEVPSYTDYIRSSNASSKNASKQAVNSVHSPLMASSKDMLLDTFVNQRRRGASWGLKCMEVRCQVKTAA